jgi:hypothetical protein
LRKLALLAPVLLCCSLATSPPPSKATLCSSAVPFCRPRPVEVSLLSGNIAEKGGTYLGVSGDVVGFKHRLGFNIETAWRASQANYLIYEVNLPPDPDRLQRALPAEAGQEDRSRSFWRHRHCQHPLLRPYATSAPTFPGASTTPPAITSWKISAAVSAITSGTTSLSVPRSTTTTSKTTSNSDRCRFQLRQCLPRGRLHRIHHRQRLGS